MKVKLLALAVSAAVAAPGVAMAAPTVYGKMNVSFENVDLDDGTDSADNWQLISNSSRFGVKGEEKINSALNATYVIEWGVSGDGDGTDLSQRNRSVGLAGNFGAFDVGHFDTPTKVSQGKVDLFNDLSGDLQYVLTGDTRAKDILQYTTPNMSGLQGKLAFMPGEEFDDGVAGTDENDGFADAFSASLSFTNKMIYAAIAHDSEVTSDIYGGLDGTGLEKFGIVQDTTRLTGQFTTGPIQLGLIYQMSESSDPTDAIDEDLELDVEQDGFLLSGAYTIGQTVLKAQYVSSTTEVSPVGSNETLENDAESLGFGVDQKLSAQTTVFGYYNMLSYEEDTPNSEEESKDNLGVGIVHNF